MPRRGGRALRPILERNILAEAHWPLVLWAVRKYAPSSYRRRWEDRLVSAACLGLVHAASYFDESRGTRFTTLAAICMRGRVREEVKTISSELDRTILPATDRGLAALRDPGPGPLEQAIQRDEAAMLRRAVARLPANYREVVEAHLASVPPRQVALAKGVSPSAV